MEIRDTIELSVKRPDSFRAIQEGLKLGEVRLYRGFITTINSGDIVSIVCGKDEVWVRVTRIDIYDTIDEMLIQRNNSGILGKNNIKKEYYEEFYKKEDLDRYQVAVIMFNIL